MYDIDTDAHLESVQDREEFLAKQIEDEAEEFADKVVTDNVFLIERLTIREEEVARLAAKVAYYEAIKRFRA